MKDKMARRIIDQIADRMGCHIDDWGLGVVDLFPNGGKDRFFDMASYRSTESKFNELYAKIDLLGRQNDALKAKFAAQEESAKPVCKSCGQKIQEGLQVGNVEALAAGLKKGGNSKK